MEKFKKLVVRVRGIIIHNGKLLGVKHSNDTNFCILPGGHLGQAEDIKECLSREIEEGFGIAPKISRLLYVNNFMDGDIRQSIEFFFEIKNSEDYLKIDHLKKTHGHEIAEVCWMEPSSKIPLLPNKVWEDFKKGDIISDKVKFIEMHY